MFIEELVKYIVHITNDILNKDSYLKLFKHSTVTSKYKSGGKQFISDCRLVTLKNL